jgi:hypothetical protein
VQNAEASSRAVRSILELTRAPAFREPLETNLKLKDLVFSTTDAPRFGKIQVATFLREEGKSRPDANGVLAPRDRDRDASAG